MPMKIICTIPERLCTAAQISSAEQALTSAYREHFGEAPRLTILWCGLPAGQSFVAGIEDDVYIVMLEVPEGLEQDRREAAMMGFTRSFASAFDLPLEKPLVSALPPSKVNEYLAANRKRLHWLHRPGFLLGTLLHAVTSRRRNGFSAIRANL